LKKVGEDGGKQTNSKFFLENRQSEYFCLTYFSKLNRDHIGEKLWHFEDNPVSGGEGGTFQKILKKRHHLSLGFVVRFNLFPLVLVGPQAIGCFFFCLQESQVENAEERTVFFSYHVKSHDRTNFGV
jgi:hypothetical protein